MLTRMSWWLGFLSLVGGVFVALSWTQGQEGPSSTSQPPALGNKPQSPLGTATSATERSVRDLSKLPPLQRQMVLSAQRGADWLFRANRQDGRFVYGFLPALRTNLEGDHYLRQVGAAYSLTRAARFATENPYCAKEMGERYAVRAKQAILALLLDTSVDPRDPQVRSTTLPSMVVNRLAAAGLLVLAIHELPDPAKDLLDQAEQLCNYIHRQQQTDGSLSISDPPGDAKATSTDPDGVNYYPGEALYGLMLSQRRSPAPWKLEVVRKALPYYRGWWQDHKSMAMVPWQTAAYTEAYLLTKEAAFADFVNEMNDWLCGLQYVMIDPRHPLWVGGFMGWMDGKPVPDEPQIGSAAYAESLADACRIARQLGDLPRHQRYRESLERCLQYVTTLQYTDANTQHFADWYRPTLLGAFHASHQDGNLRIDYTQHAVCALTHYLTHVAELP